MSGFSNVSTGFSQVKAPKPPQQTVDDWLSGTPDFSNMNPGDVFMRFLEDAFKGRKFGADALMGLLTGYNDDPTIKALEGALGKAAEPVVSDSDLSSMLALSRNTLGKSYQNQMSGLSNALGSMNLTPGSGVSQELAAAMRFGTLAQQSQNDLATQLEAKQMNRAGLENYLGLGNQYAANKFGFQGQIGFGLSNLFSGGTGQNLLGDLIGIMALPKKQREQFFGG